MRSDEDLKTRAILGSDETTFFANGEQANHVLRMIGMSGGGNLHGGVMIRNSSIGRSARIRRYIPENRANFPVQLAKTVATRDFSACALGGKRRHAIC
jgi:hypothetical protein